MAQIDDSNRALVLAALFNAARPQGMSFLAYQKDHIMTEEEAKEILDSGTRYFDYLEGRVMKVDLKGPFIDFYLYDRDNGQEAGYRATKGLLL